MSPAPVPVARTVVALGFAALAVSGCGARAAAGESAQVPASASPTAVTAQDVVAAFDGDELAVTGATDTTKADCGSAVRCSQSVTTDQVVVRSFPGSGPAELYANPVGAFHVFTITLTFADSVSQAERRAYEAVATRVAT